MVKHRFLEGVLQTDVQPYLAVSEACDVQHYNHDTLTYCVQ